MISKGNVRETHGSQGGHHATSPINRTQSWRRKKISGQHHCRGSRSQVGQKGLDSRQVTEFVDIGDCHYPKTGQRCHGSWNNRYKQQVCQQEKERLKGWSLLFLDDRDFMTMSIAPTSLKEEGNAELDEIWWRVRYSELVRVLQDRRQKAKIGSDPARQKNERYLAVVHHTNERNLWGIPLVDTQKRIIYIVAVVASA